MSKLENMVNALLLTRARVHTVEDVSEHFRRVLLDPPDGRSFDFRPGDKVQVRTAPWQFRTLTPLRDGERMALLVFHHAASPMGTWVREAKPGGTVELFGPRGSIDLPALPGPHVLFGDETSVAVACAHQTLSGEHESFLESSHPAELEQVCQRFGVRATVVAKESGDTHLAALAGKLSETQRPLIFTGRAQSLQALRGHLGAGKKHIAKTKAYWAPGKRGLD